MGEIFCPTCAQSVEPLPPEICSCCGNIQTELIVCCTDCQIQIENAAFSIDFKRNAALYTHPIRSAIHALKYENCREMAPLLARYLVAAFAKPCWQNLPSAIDAVIPVPTHLDRKKERGYNQAELLATEFCRRTQLNLQPAWVERIEYKRSQVGLTMIERFENVQNAFLASSHVQGRTILLIDDLCTTGATLNACAAAIKDAGGRATYALALATPVSFDL